MILIPAIDLKQGKCVRLRQGRMAEATVFSDDPVAMATHWAQQGAQRLHIVDLDGAFAGEPRNRQLIESMIKAVGAIPVQVGGGVREESVIEGYLEAGVQAVIIGTKAIEDPEFFATVATRYPQRLMLGLDARDGYVASDGWDHTSAVTALELAQNAASLPTAGIVYTDIHRDGMMTGVNAEATVALAQAAGVPVVASGGVTNAADLERLKAAFAGCPELLIGAITGRAIYEGTLTLAEGAAVFGQARR